MLCTYYRPWTHGPEDWFKSIGKLLDARLCIDVEGGETVTIGSIYKQWQLSKLKPKPSESGDDVRIEEYLG
jgi:hypothetical protein